MRKDAGGTHHNKGNTGHHLGGGAGAGAGAGAGGWRWSHRLRGRRPSIRRVARRRLRRLSRDQESTVLIPQGRRIDGHVRNFSIRLNITKRQRILIRIESNIGHVLTKIVRIDIFPPDHPIRAGNGGCCGCC